MTEAAVIKLLVALAQALPALTAPLLALLRPDVAADVRAQLAASHARLEAMTSPRADVEDVIARHRIAPTTAPTLERIAASRVHMTDEEREHLRAAASLVRAAEDGHLVAALPAVLDVPPRNPFEPDHPED